MTNRQASSKRRSTADLVRLYLQDIGRVDLLSHEEELTLARLVQKREQLVVERRGLCSKHPDVARLEALEEQRLRETSKLGHQPSQNQWAQACELSPADLRAQVQLGNKAWAELLDMSPGDLQRQLLHGRRAKERMIQANLRLVVKIAHDYEGLGLPLLDLINEGNIGLMKAVERFDPTKGSKLSTYSAWWIKQAIKRSLANQSKTIRLPVHLVDKISKLKRTALKLQEALGREPPGEELGEEMEMGALKVARLRRAAIRPASLDSPIGDDNSTFAEIVSDEKAENPYKQLEDKTVNDMLYDLIKTLPHREATILEYRFGLDGGSERTLEEVGEHFNVTRERVRQIQNLALSKLRKMIEKMESVQK